MLYLEKIIMLSYTFLMKQNWKTYSSYMSPKTQSESFVLIYEGLKVILWISLPIHIQNTNFKPENEEIELLCRNRTPPKGK